MSESKWQRMNTGNKENPGFHSEPNGVFRIEETDGKRIRITRYSVEPRTGRKLLHSVTITKIEEK